MSKVKHWFKQKFCTHYHEVTTSGMPIFTIHPRKVVLTPGWLTLRHANYKGLVDPDAKRCLNCETYYFETDGRGFLL